jgi:hypothetical protein
MVSSLTTQAEYGMLFAAGRRQLCELRAGVSRDPKAGTPYINTP